MKQISNKGGQQQSITRCEVGEHNFDSDYYEICYLDDVVCCETCYADQITQ